MGGRNGGGSRGDTTDLNTFANAVREVLGLEPLTRHQELASGSSDERELLRFHQDADVWPATGRAETVDDYDPPISSPMRRLATRRWGRT